MNLDFLLRAFGHYAYNETIKSNAIVIEIYSPPHKTRYITESRLNSSFEMIALPMQSLNIHIDYSIRKFKLIFPLDFYRR